MARVLAEVLCAVNDVAFAAKVVNSMGDALSINVFLCASTKVLLLLHAKGVLDAVFEHFARLLAQLGVLLVVGLEVLLPGALDEGCHLHSLAPL